MDFRTDDQVCASRHSENALLPTLNDAAFARVAVLSDLHLAGGRLSLPDPAADVVVLAGDIDDAQSGVEWANRTFKCPVVYVLGNHEYRRSSIFARLAECRAAASPHVHVLEQESATICGVRFLGATLWTDCTLFGMDCQREHFTLAATHCMDFRSIQSELGYFVSPQEIAEIHAVTRRWLEGQLRVTTDSTIIVTHHAPSPQSLPAHLLGTCAAATYATDLRALMGNVPIWIHGHIHTCSDYLVEGTRVICNPYSSKAPTTVTVDGAGSPWVVVSIRRTEASETARGLAPQESIG